MRQWAAHGGGGDAGPQRRGQRQQILLTAAGAVQQQWGGNDGPVDSDVGVGEAVSGRVGQAVTVSRGAPRFQGGVLKAA